jgi:hypothetical protein
MNHRTAMSALVLAGLCLAPAPSAAQPAGATAPGAGLWMAQALTPRDQLLKQAQQMVADLTTMKSSGTLGEEQAAEVDELLPLATALSNELEKPQTDAASLRELSGDLAEMQKQVSALKRR